MEFKNIRNEEILAQILDFVFISKSKYKKISCVYWFDKNKNKGGLTLKFYNDTKELKNYILKLSWIQENDKFRILDYLTDFAQDLPENIMTQITKKD